jgi:hypothetical protein
LLHTFPGNFSANSLGKSVNRQLISSQLQVRFDASSMAWKVSQGKVGQGNQQDAPTTISGEPSGIPHNGLRQPTQTATRHGLDELTMVAVRYASHGAGDAGRNRPRTGTIVHLGRGDLIECFAEKERWWSRYV